MLKRKLDISTSVEDFILAKEEHSQELYDSVVDDYSGEGARGQNHDIAKTRMVWLNLYGTPWWNCPHTGNRCSRECASFVKAGTRLRNWEESKEIYVITGFKCGQFQ